MPFYEYQCRACGAQVEVMQKISDAPLKKCPECGRNQLTKLVSAPVFRLKGGGWYETDFKSDKDNKRNLVDSDKGEAKPEAKADDKADAKTEAKSDAKPDAKPESKGESKGESKAAAKPAAKPVTGKPAKSRPTVKSRGKARR